jgi:release factor family 6
MTTATDMTMKTLDLDELRTLARQTGPCITLQIPAVKPGAGDGSRHAYLRQLTQDASNKLSVVNRSPEAAQVIATMERLVASMDDQHGGPALTLFCAPAFAGVYETPEASAAKAMVGSRFHLLPLLATALASHQFFILGLSQNKIRFVRYAEGRCDEQPLPPGVPVSLDEAGAFDKPDHRLENFSSAGNTSGSQKGIRFGNSSDHDDKAEYLHHFYVMIDKGLKDVLNGAPLFLAGVREELVEYRRLAKYKNIFAAECNGNVEHASLDQLAAHARSAALREYYTTAGITARLLQEVRNKISGDPGEAFLATHEGRVRQVVAAEDAPFPSRGDENLYVGEDIVNACIVEGLRTSADVFSLAGGEVLPGSSLVVALRY